MKRTEKEHVNSLEKKEGACEMSDCPEDRVDLGLALDFDLDVVLSLCYDVTITHP